MKNYSETNDHLIRSGTRIRESVRCLPRGHFQQIRQMFDKQKSSNQLPVTDDEKLQQQRTNIDDILSEDYDSSECQVFPNQSSLSKSNKNYFHTGSEKQNTII